MASRKLLIKVQVASSLPWSVTDVIFSTSLLKEAPTTTPGLFLSYLIFASWLSSSSQILQSHSSSLIVMIESLLPGGWESWELMDVILLDEVWRGERDIKIVQWICGQAFNFCGLKFKIRTT